jgi:two-component system sensor histidine kinase UhpB
MIFQYFDRMKRMILLCFILVTLFYQNIYSQKINIDSVKIELAKAKEDTSKVILYRILAGTLRMSDPAQGIQYGKAGVALGKKLGFDKGIAGCYLNITACYSSAGKVDSAIIYIDTAIIYSHKAGDPNRLALAYLNRGDFYMQLQNFDQSLKDCDTSLRYAEQANNDDRRARVFQTIGSVYLYQKLYDQSAEYYNKANVLYKKINNLQMSAVVLNNLSLVYKNTNEYKKAAENLEQAIGIADSLNDLSNLAMYYGTLSDVYFHSDNLTLAEKYANTSMQYAQQMKNDLSIANAWEYSGQIYLRQNKISEAVTALNNGYVIFKKYADADKLSTTTDLLSQAYAKNNNYEKALEFANLSRAANDTLIKHRYDEDLASMQARFRVDEKDKEILLLNKDNELQKQKLSQQRVLIAGSIVLVAFLLIGIWLLVSRYRLRQRMKELQLRNEIAADLHDEVGSSLSSIHMLSEMATTNSSHDFSQKEILNKVSGYTKETMDKMGDIVWMIKPTSQEGVKERMHRFLHEMCNSRNINCTFDANGLSQSKLDMHQRKGLYLVFKEAVNNAVKYSTATNINVRINEDEQYLRMAIKDDGKGFDISMNRSGNGVGNMKNRAKELGGETTIDSVPGKGTTVYFRIPV